MVRSKKTKQKLLSHNPVKSRFFFAALFITVAIAPPCFAQDEDESIFDYRTLFRLSVWGNQNPDLPYKAYENSFDNGAYAVARFIGEMNWSESFSAELNIYGVHSGFSSSLGVSAGARDVERSSLLMLEGRESETTSSQAAVDRLSATLDFGSADITVGRQPINFATCYYFTPNDFFAPFGAATFYRVYKPGVDAVRLEVGVGDLSQFSAVAVMGYEPSSENITGWSDTPDGDRSSYVARYSFVVSDIDIALLGGSLARDQVVGLGVQGDLPFWELGFRVEGNYRLYHEDNRATDGDESTTEVVLQLEKRFESSLNLTMEYFHHGAGANEVAKYRPGQTGMYLADKYFAFGGSYELTPLFSTQALVLANLVDDSKTFSIYGVYSLSDEAEGSLSFSYPIGDTDPNLSEYGLYPISAGVEIRIYF